MPIVKSPDSRGSVKIRFAGPDKLVGGLIGRYRVMRVLGVGGMGTVVEARSVDSGEPVAIKVLRPDAVTPSNLRRFQREVKAVAALDHAYISKILGFGMLDTGAPYMVIELLRGETLRARLKDRGALGAGDAVGITLQLLDALQLAHSRGVIHRDLKPGNIFLTTPANTAPSIKLIDFGLARLIPRTISTPASEDASAITATDEIAGTPSYWAPEQLRGARDLDERVDIWGVAVVLYEMLAGAKAFSAESDPVLRAKIAYEDPIPLRAYRDDVPLDLESIVMKALEKDRERRFLSASALRETLLQCWVAHRSRGIALGRSLSRARLRGMVQSVRDEHDTLVGALDIPPRR